MTDQPEEIDDREALLRAIAGAAYSLTADGRGIIAHPAVIADCIEAAGFKRQGEADYADAYCLAHPHQSRADEAVCSLRFQLADAQAEAGRLREALKEIRSMVVPMGYDFGHAGVLAIVDRVLP